MENILDNEVFEGLLRLCWSGIVALIMLAPPCKEYFKLRRAGPKPCSTWMGSPAFRFRSVKNCWIARQSTTVAEPCSGQWSPKEALAFGNSRHQPCPANFQMLRDRQCALVWVDACRHNKAFSKSWAFGCNSSKIRALEARCNHSYKHRSIAGVKEQGVYLSTLTAEYPPSLALQLAQVGIGRVSKTGSFRQALPLHSDFSRPLTLAPCRLPTCDGAGMRSSADWCCPKPEHPLQAVARPWLHSESLEVATLAYTALKLPSDMSPESGQPYRLHLLQALTNSWGDPDMALLPFLQHGVPTGAVSALPPSLQWPAKKPDSALPRIWNL